jgi:threonyl-tRNA synthetase
VKSLLFHCKDYKTKVIKLANRPYNINPEKINGNGKECKDCIVILITVEKGDSAINIVPKLAEEIKKMSEEIKRKSVVLLPFAHLSNNLALAEEGISFINELEKSLKVDLEVIRDHFGSHKELLLSLYGHPGNARYREFY